MSLESWGPAGAVVIMLSLIELVKYVAARRQSSNGGMPNGFMTTVARMESTAQSCDRKLELILQELKVQREHTIRYDERHREFRRRMEQHMESMECIRKDR